MTTRRAAKKGKQKETAALSPGTGTPARRAKTTLAPSSSPQASQRASSNLPGLADASGGQPTVPVASSTRAHLPSATIPRFLFPRPQVTRDAPALPVSPELIRVVHPANDVPFLQLPAYDPLPGLELQFGLHYETVLTACTIVAYNCPGYLSKSRDGDEPVDLALDLVLLPGSYYYHVNDCEPGELYPICQNFWDWTFPHQNMPLSWLGGPLTENQDWPSNLTAASQKLKDRDGACLISGSTEYVTTAHIVSKEDAGWLDLNKMGHFLGDILPLHRSPRNLFCLRYDLYLGGFDQAQFVIVPKGGNLVVHFLRRSEENASLYHNVAFNHNNCLSPAMLYARFAWALMKLVRESELNPEFFNFTKPKESSDKDQMPGASDKGKGKGRKRKYDDRGGNQSGDENGGYGPDVDKSGTRVHEDLDAPSIQPDSWLSDVLHKMAPGDQSSLEADTREIEEDLRIAAQYHPFLVNPAIKPTAHDYHDILWYPGIEVVRRRKRAYLDSNPQIRAFSNPDLQSNRTDYDSD